MKLLLKILRIVASGFAALLIAVGFSLISTDLGAGIFGISSGVLVLLIAWQRVIRKRLSRQGSKKKDVESIILAPIEESPTTEAPIPETDIPSEPTPEVSVPDAPECPYVEKVYHVTGMSYYMDGLMSLAVENDEYDYSKKEIVDNFMYDESIYRYSFYFDTIELIPEPENPYDKNAIKVVIDGEQVGHIKAGSCAHLLKVIKEDRIHKISCTIGGGPLKRVISDYDDEKDKDVYTLERETRPYFVILRILEMPSK